jgi:hypothetical protein
MPLNYQKPKLPNPIIERVKSVITQIISYFRPDVALGIFTIAGILLAFTQRGIGFWLAYSVFIICYFVERIIKLTSRSKE